MRGSDVSQVQRFLVSQNYAGGGSWMITGFYGRATIAAMRTYQAQTGLSVTGAADSITRNAIANATCGSISNPYFPNNPYINPYVSLNLTSLSQNTGSVGTQITVYGTGFDSVNNTVNFGPIVLSGVPSNGNSISFIVPNYSASGNVNITVHDSLGTSNALVFTVYNYGYTCGSNYFYTYGSCGCANGQYPYASQNSGQVGGGVYPYNYNGYNTGYSNCVTNPINNTQSPTIDHLSPVSGGVATPVTVYGSGFTTNGNTVHFGNAVIANLISSDGQSVSFTVPAQLNGYGSQNIGLGLYGVSVTNSLGYTSNVLPFTVTSVLGTSGTPTTSGVTPTSGHVATQVTIYGTNFTGNNTVNFGSGAIANVYSANGTSIVFTIPSYVAPVCNTGYACPMYAQAITPGTYTMTVQNTNGTSNPISFLVN
jgi:hypothetical protein